MQISVITPALNPREEFIQRVFRALASQTLPRSSWEYIVVDSGSEPALRQRLDLAWHPHATILEAPGKRLAVSRLRGMERAQGDLIVFVDDDNILAPDYLETALHEMARLPQVGVLGGHVEAEFLGAVAPWMHDFLPILGASKYRPEPEEDLCYALIKAAGPWVPAGSGMIVRNQVVAEYRRQVAADADKLVIGRVGDRLQGSDDVDLAYTAIDLGLAIGRSRRPRLQHLIPESRLTVRYLERLLYASNYATAALLVRRGWKKPCPPLKLPRAVRPVNALTAWRQKSPDQRGWKALGKGYEDGMAGEPFDAAYL
jgi:glycosyltransferase involved in cell wall biosynthesis